MDGYATVRDIARQGDGTYTVFVEVGNRFGSEIMEFVLLDGLFAEIGLEMGEIGEETVELLELMARTTAAYGSACTSFAYSPCSHKALKRKLIAKGFSFDASERALDIVRERGFINEEQIALRRAELMVEKLWGRTRILAKLREELFEDSALEAVVEYLGEVDFSENCARVIEKKYPSIPVERREREKMYAALSRLGFSPTDIREAMRYISENE